MDETKLPGGDGHEHGDINITAVTKAGLGIAAGVIVSVFLMWFLLDRFAERGIRSGAGLDPSALVDPRKEPPEPRLQAAPVVDLREFRAAEEAILNSYGWVDPEKGIVRIPVERALEMIAKEGLPARREGIDK